MMTSSKLVVKTIHKGLEVYYNGLNRLNYTLDILFPYRIFLAKSCIFIFVFEQNY